MLLAIWLLSLLYPFLTVSCLSLTFNEGFKTRRRFQVSTDLNGRDDAVSVKWSAGSALYNEKRQKPSQATAQPTKSPQSQTITPIPTTTSSSPSSPPSPSVSATTSDAPKISTSGGPPTTTIAGIVVGIVGFAALVLTALFLHNRRKVALEKKAVPFSEVSTLSRYNSTSTMGYAFTQDTYKDADSLYTLDISRTTSHSTPTPTSIMMVRDRALPCIPERSAESTPTGSTFGPITPPVTAPVSPPRAAQPASIRILPLPPIKITQIPVTATAMSATETVSVYSQPSPLTETQLATPLTCRPNSITKPRIYSDHRKSRYQEKQDGNVARIAMLERDAGGKIPQEAMEEIARLRAENRWLKEQQKKYWEEEDDDDVPPPRYIAVSSVHLVATRH